MSESDNLSTSDPISFRKDPANLALPAEKAPPAPSNPRSEWHAGPIGAFIEKVENSASSLAAPAKATEATPNKMSLGPLGMLIHVAEDEVRSLTGAVKGPESIAKQPALGLIETIIQEASNMMLSITTKEKHSKLPGVGAKASAAQPSPQR